MSGVNNVSAKWSHQKNRFAFPDDIEIPESALNDRKFLSSYVNIFNDPRVYKRQRLNGDRTSSRFDVDNHCNIKVVFNEPIIKRKSILSSTQISKDDSGIRKSVSFLSKITIIDSIDLDGVSSDWTDVEGDDDKEKTKAKSKTPKIEKLSKSVKKLNTEAVSNDKPSSKNKKKKKDKSSARKNGHKVKSAQKELLKFKITKPFRKFGRSKDKKLKHLQKKFGRRMFKAFVQVKRSFNLKNIPDKVTVPLEKITLKKSDVTTPEKCVTSIQDFLIGQMTKNVKVSLTPVQRNAGDTIVPMITGTEIKIESNSFEKIENLRRTENDNDQSDNPVDRQEMEEVSETNQNNDVVPSTESLNSDQTDEADRNDRTNKMNGDVVPGEMDDCPEEAKTESCNDTEPSLEVVETDALPNIIDKITCSMYYNTNKDETVTMNGQMLESNASDDHMDLVENISTFNVSFSMPTKSLTDNILGCDSPEISQAFN